MTRKVNLQKYSVKDLFKSFRRQISNFGNWLVLFLRRYWVGGLVILLTTLIFFMPLIKNLGTYSEGGDMSFNAWTLARNHHCILRENCPRYTDANIFYPNKDSMLYSETQFSAGLLTLPLYFINQNPLFSYGIWTVASIFFSGWFMYILAKRLSRNNELISVTAGLLFSLAPIRMTSLFHLQNLSIFYLPLIVFALIRFNESGLKRHLVVFFTSLLLLFYASWYQMVFGLVVVTILLLLSFVFRLAKISRLAALSLALLLALVFTLPLAKEYVRFSKSENATFSLKTQTLYSSSVTDYIAAPSNTLAGAVQQRINPNTRSSPYNLDSNSYLGVTLVLNAVLVTTLSLYYFSRSLGSNKKRVVFDSSLYYQSLMYLMILITGVVFSFGPFIKLKGEYLYSSLLAGSEVAIVGPWLLIERILPQLNFIRALGRFNIISLFALCCLLALLPVILSYEKRLKKRTLSAITAFFCILTLLELMPTKQIRITDNNYAYNLNIPAVYRYVRSNKDVTNLIVLRSKEDYDKAPFPVARAEDVLWSGFHNRNIFNGYSGYQPRKYSADYSDYADFTVDDIVKLKKIGVEYVLVDKLLSTSDSGLIKNTSTLKGKLYEDNRYVLYKLLPSN